MADFIPRKHDLNRKNLSALAAAAAAAVASFVDAEIVQEDVRSE